MDLLFIIENEQHFLACLYEPLQLSRPSLRTNIVSEAIFAIYKVFEKITSFPPLAEYS